MAHHGRALAQDALLLSDLVDAVYQTVEAPELWPEVLSKIGSAVGASQTLMFLTEPAAMGEGTLACLDTPPELVDDFLAHYASVNVLAQPCDQMFPDGTVRYSHWAVSERDFERSEFYTDFFSRLDLYYSLGIKAPLATGGLAYLSMQRPKRAAAFAEPQGELVRVLLPHLQRALALHVVTSARAFAQQSAEAGLAAFGKMVFGLDTRGRLRYANAEAQALLRSGDALYVAGGHIRARDTGCDQALSRAIQAVLRRDEGCLHGRQATAWVRRPDDAHALRVVALPWTGTRAFECELAALLLVSDEQTVAVSRATSLTSLYGLTPTETRVADLLLNGRDARGVATQLGTTVETARFHIKRILAKTGQPRQAELIRLLLELPGG